MPTTPYCANEMVHGTRCGQVDGTSVYCLLGRSCSSSGWCGVGEQYQGGPQFYSDRKTCLLPWRNYHCVSGYPRDLHKVFARKRSLGFASPRACSVYAALSGAISYAYVAGTTTTCDTWFSHDWAVARPSIDARSLCATGSMCSEWTYCEVDVSTLPNWPPPTKPPDDMRWVRYACSVAVLLCLCTSAYLLARYQSVKRRTSRELREGVMDTIVVEGRHQTALFASPVRRSSVVDYLPNRGSVLAKTRQSRVGYTDTVAMAKYTNSGEWSGDQAPGVPWSLSVTEAQDTLTSLPTAGSCSQSAGHLGRPKTHHIRNISDMMLRATTTIHEDEFPDWDDWDDHRYSTIMMMPPDQPAPRDDDIVSADSNVEFNVSRPTSPTRSEQLAAPSILEVAHSFAVELNPGFQNNLFDTPIATPVRRGSFRNSSWTQSYSPHQTLWSNLDSMPSMSQQLNRTHTLTEL